MQKVDLTAKSPESASSTFDLGNNEHISEGNMESFVSFQEGEKHLCGGVRLKPLKVLIFLRCHLRIHEKFENISVVIPALPNDWQRFFSINSSTGVGQTSFYIVTVSSTSQNLRLRPETSFILFYIT